MNKTDIYKSHKSLWAFTCYYCGNPADGVDHYPPKRVRHLWPHIERLLLRCCNACNMFLNVSMQDTLKSRRDAALRRFL